MRGASRWRQATHSRRSRVAHPVQVQGSTRSREPWCGVQHRPQLEQSQRNAVRLATGCKRSVSHAGQSREPNHHSPTSRGTKLSVNTCIRQPFLKCREDPQHEDVPATVIAGRLREFLVDLTVRRALNHQCVGRSHIVRRIVRVARSKPTGRGPVDIRHSCSISSSEPLPTSDRLTPLLRNLRCHISAKHSRRTHVRAMSATQTSAFCESATRDFRPFRTAETRQGRGDGKGTHGSLDERVRGRAIVGLLRRAS